MLLARLKIIRGIRHILRIHVLQAFNAIGSRRHNMPHLHLLAVSFRWRIHRIPHLLGQSLHAEAVSHLGGSHHYLAHHGIHAVAAVLLHRIRPRRHMDAVDADARLHRLHQQQARTRSHSVNIHTDKLRVAVAVLQRVYGHICTQRKEVLSTLVFLRPRRLKVKPPLSHRGNVAHVGRCQLIHALSRLRTGSLVLVATCISLLVVRSIINTTHHLAHHSHPFKPLTLVRAEQSRSHTV